MNFSRSSQGSLASVCDPAEAAPPTIVVALAIYVQMMPLPESPNGSTLPTMVGAYPEVVDRRRDRRVFEPESLAHG